MTTTTDTPAASPGMPALDHRRVLIIIGALMSGMLLAALDQTIVSTALPTIVGDLKGASHLSWVVTAYLLASTASMPLWGKLGDLYGRKRYFQAAIVIFLVGSVLSGLSRSMIELIAFRALQGLGGGGLMVGAQAIVGDIVPPRDRGRYQGLFGAVFGLATVVGPLAGGLLTEHLSWRWVFYVNLPIGAVALVVTAAVLPEGRQRLRHSIDYLGTLLLAGGITSLVLLTSLGGTTYSWNSAPIYLFGVVGVVLLGLWAVVERRAAEPVLPLRLFRNRTFSAASAIGFVVGFAMFGAITFLPLFLQDVHGQSPTTSGLLLLPLMGGLLTLSIASGQLISRFGRYKVFPVVGTALMTVGLFLFTFLQVDTNLAVMGVFMFVLGAGLGCVMQVLVLAAQNSVPPSDMGVATSGATFFRSIGGSFGTAVFGAIFSNVLAGKLNHALAGVPLPAGTSPSRLAQASASPAVLAQLPLVLRNAFRDAFSASLHVVFWVSVPIALVAFGMTFLLPELRLRRSAGATAGQSPEATGALVTSGVSAAGGAAQDAVAAGVSPSAPPPTA